VVKSKPKYTKLFNSSKKENDNVNAPNEGDAQKKNKENSKQAKKKQRVSFEKTEKPAAGGKKGGIKSAPKAKKKTEEKLHSLDGGLNDTDDEVETSKLNTLSRAVLGEQLANTRIDIIPFRGIGIDNRALPTLHGDAMTRSFLVKMVEFMEGALEKDLLSGKTSGGSVVACLKEKKVQAKYLEGNVSERGQWFADFLASGGVHEAENCRFDYGSDDMCVDEGRVCKLEGFGASDSWKCFGDMGT
jgi:hypothetical protein